jgi:hypothetical protein
MLSNRIRRLTPPPRSVPLPIVCSAMLGITGSFGAIFLIMGLIFTLIFTYGYRPIDNLRLAFSKTTARGIITGVSETNATENEVEVYEYQFAFTARNEKEYSGSSYTTGRSWSVEVPVTVEYVPEDPSIARIQGARSSLFTPWILFVLIFPAVGAALFIMAAIGGLRQAALLRYGQIADAHIISSRPTGMTVNDAPVVEFTYEIRTSAGETFDGKSKTLAYGRIGDEEPEPALYLPSHPGLSTLVDAVSLSYPLDVDESTGKWVSQGGYLKAILYILAWVAAIALSGYGLLTTFGIVR